MIFVNNWDCQIWRRVSKQTTIVCIYFCQCWCPLVNYWLLLISRTLVFYQIPKKMLFETTFAPVAKILSSFGGSPGNRHENARADWAGIVENRGALKFIALNYAKFNGVVKASKKAQLFRKFFYRNENWGTISKFLCIIRHVLHGLRIPWITDNFLNSEFTGLIPYK